MKINNYREGEDRTMEYEKIKQLMEDMGNSKLTEIGRAHV